MQSGGESAYFVHNSMGHNGYIMFFDAKHE